MRSLSSTLALSLALTAAAAQAQPAAPAWPRLDGEARAECTQALDLATHVFNSRAFQLVEALDAPPGFGSTRVLWADGVDLSDGDAVNTDPQVFDKLPLHQSTPRSLYWQRHPAGGYRLALAESNYGWRGDRYWLYAFDPAVQPDAAVAIADAAADGGRAPAVARVVVDGAWRPPQIYRLGADGPLWVLTVDGPGWFLAPWTVYVPGTDTLRQACTIQFRPEAEHAVDLLPGPVRALDAMLDKTIGSGIGEGSLAQTARLRVNVEHTWADVAIRPWAAAGAYNDRATVDRALAAWGGGNAASRGLLQAIRRQYPLAQRALAGYYRDRFGVTPASATRRAAYLLDIAYRAHYVFHQDPSAAPATDAARDNPWPQPTHRN